MTRARAALLGVVLAGAVLAVSGRASALDKQASAHGGKVSGQDQGMAASGSVQLGVAAYNPSYAARPDNTGHALLRVAPHLDFDLVGRKLSLPLDLNLFSDRDRAGAKKLLPTELDLISGVTSTWPVSAATALELGLRGERDLPVDRTGPSQSYGDARLRLLYALAPAIHGSSSAPADQDWTGSFTLGWFAFNPSYAARPDNSGRALFRYGGSTGLDFLKHRLSVGVDLVSFTDRRTNALRPSELDFTPSLGYRSPVGQLQLAYERDMPLDRGHLVQQLLLISWSESFEIWSRRPEPSDASPSPPGVRASE